MQLCLTYKNVCHYDTGEPVDVCILHITNVRHVMNIIHAWWKAWRNSKWVFSWVYVSCICWMLSILQT